MPSHVPSPSVRVPPRGILISLEGVDGSGKTTQARRLAAWLRAQGWPVQETREPGGTPLGARLRKLILHPDADSVPDRVTELLLYLADRAQHLATVIRPALVRPAIVVADRYIDSTLAYQGAARKFGIAFLIALHRQLNLLHWPDWTVLLVIEPRVALQRKQAAKRGWSRFEQEDLAFHQAVAEGYAQLVRMFPERIYRVDGTLAPDRVFHDILNGLQQRFPWIRTEGTDL